MSRLLAFAARLWRSYRAPKRPTIRCTVQESALLAAIAAEVETLFQLGYSEQAVERSVQLALANGSIALTARPARISTLRSA